MFQILQEQAVLRFTLREMLWLMLVVAVGTAWQVESARGRQWRERAEIAACQLETENLGKMVFQGSGVLYQSNNLLPPNQGSFVPTSAAP